MRRLERKARRKDKILERARGEEGLMEGKNAGRKKGRKEGEKRCLCNSEDP